MFSFNCPVPGLLFLNSWLNCVRRSRPPKDSPFGQIVRRQLQIHLVSGSQVEPGSLAGDESQQPMAVHQFHSKRPDRKDFHYPTFNFEGIFSGHVKTSGSPSVINTVCSKWADNEPS